MRRVAIDLNHPALVILTAIAVLMVLGVASIGVTDTHYVSGHDGGRNAIKQCIFAVVGVLGGMVVLRVGYQEIGRLSYTFFVAAVVLLVPLLVAKVTRFDFGGLIAPRNGAYRWIHLPGYQLQPSEIMKVAYLLALAWYLRYRRNYMRFSGLMTPIIVSAVPLMLILLEPDLGTALLLVPVLFALLFVAGARLRHLAVFVLAGAVLAPLAWNKLEPYQRLRVTAVLLQSDELRQKIIDQPAGYEKLATRRQAMEWSASAGYQLVQSKNAIGSGGVSGYGWGEGLYVTSGLLPDRHNDFVFAVVAHQWGLVGCLVVLACYVAIAAAGLRIASETTEPFARLLAVGVVVMILSQAIINMGMAVGLMPVTGMTLPFVSYGGSSLLTNCVAVGLLLAVGQHRPYLLAVKPKELALRPGEEAPGGAKERVSNVPVARRAAV